MLTNIILIKYRLICSFFALSSSSFQHSGERRTSQANLGVLDPLSFGHQVLLQASGQMPEAQLGTDVRAGG